MKQFVVPVDCTDELELVGQDYHYLHNVRRLGQGDSFSGIDADGRRYHVLISELLEGSLRVQVMPVGPPAPDLPAVHLYQCVPKGGKFDQVIRMATEAGAASITPVISERTVVRFDAHNAEKKRSRWQKIVQEAVQQSGSPHIPPIGLPCSLESLLKEGSNSGGMVFFHQTPLASTSLHQYCSESHPEYRICIGPEGGFSPREVQLMQDADWHSGYLGPWVLRTEHAGMYAIAAIQTILLEKASWKIQT
ncbi:MAG: RsmE family RNA methyltransferase [Spirochaeta sp.]